MNTPTSLKVSPLFGDHPERWHRLLLRHGQPESVVTECYQGPDIKLTSQGETEARLLGRYVDRIARVDHFISGTIERQQRTRDLMVSELQRSDLRNEDSPLFNEMVVPRKCWYQKWDDPTAQAIMAEHERRFYDRDYHPDDAEGFWQLRDRALRAVDYLRPANLSARCAVIVTSSDFLKMFFAVLEHGTELTPDIYERIKRCNAYDMASQSVFFFGTEGKIRIQSRNHRPDIIPWP